MTMWMTDLSVLVLQDTRATTCRFCDIGYHTVNGQSVSAINPCTIDTYGNFNQFIKCSKTDPCLNGSTCSDDVNNGPQCACLFGYGGATCATCDAGYLGTNCESCAIGYHTMSGAAPSVNDPCISNFYGANNQFVKCTKTNPCLQGGLCSDDVDKGPQCRCATGYTGSTCQLCATGYHTENGQPVSATTARLRVIHFYLFLTKII